MILFIEMFVIPSTVQIPHKYKIILYIIKQKTIKIN